jgi:hypothetical protein
LTIPPRWTEKKLLRHGDNVMQFLIPTDSDEKGDSSAPA